MGQYGEETRNGNGKRLNICEEYEMKINNPFFQHNDIHKYTWFQRTKTLKSIIDFGTSKIFHSKYKKKSETIE